MPCRSLLPTPQQVEKVTPLDSDATCPFVGEALRTLRAEVGNDSTVLGFVGAPFTLASYIIEGGSSKNFAHVKKMAFSNPEVLHALNSRLADSVADYVRYQASSLLLLPHSRNAFVSSPAAAWCTRTLPWIAVVAMSLSVVACERTFLLLS